MIIAKRRPYNAHYTYLVTEINFLNIFLKNITKMRDVLTSKCFTNLLLQQKYLLVFIKISIKYQAIASACLSCTTEQKIDRRHCVSYDALQPPIVELCGTDFPRSGGDASGLDPPF